MPGIRKWPGGAFAFHSWICLSSQSTPAGSIEQVFRRQLYRLVTKKKSSKFLGRHNLLKCNNVFLLKTLMMITCIYLLSLLYCPDSFVTNSGCGFEAFITMDFDLVVSVFNRKEHCSVEISNTNLGDEHWVHHYYIL